MSSKKKQESQLKAGATEHLELAAIGMESEFEVLLDGKQVRPEHLFGTPRAFIRGPLMHRTGTSYHLPTGGAVYFDTGVIEVATPVIEIDRGCAARAGRSLWESIRYIRDELDTWESRNGQHVALRGFSTHYNISFELPQSERGVSRTVEKLALLLTHILPLPVMLLSANRQSTGVGVRPRGNRIEITADFTPSPSLMIATGTLITGVVRAVMEWESFELDMLEKKKIPVVKEFRPVKHTSRQGWVAKDLCYPENPFSCDVDRHQWELRDGRTVSLRAAAGLVAKHFWSDVKAISDPFTLRLIGSVLRGRAPSLLDLKHRPHEYEDVGRAVAWDDLFPERALRRSWYERVLIRAISGKTLRLNGVTYRPVGMRGWATVVFLRESDRTRHQFSIDFLVQHLEDWEGPGEGSAATARRAKAHAGRRRRAAERRSKS